MLGNPSLCRPIKGDLRASMEPLAHLEQDGAWAQQKPWAEHLTSTLSCNLSNLGQGTRSLWAVTPPQDP